MSIAVSFSGQPRTIPIALQSWQNFIQKHNADVFIHIWDDNDNSHIKLCMALNPTLVKIEKPREFDVSKYSERLVNSDPYSVLSMWTSISESLQLVNSYKTYDTIVRARFDVNFEDFDLITDHDLVIPGKPPEDYNYGCPFKGWHDMMAYGTPYGMKVYALTLTYLPIIYNQIDSLFFSEYFLSKTIDMLRPDIVHQDVYADIVR